MTPQASNTDRKMHISLLCFGLAVLLWSGISPFDRTTWMLEIFPAVGAAIILTATYPRLRFTNLVYILVLIHSIILMIGGKYTYALVPLFTWIKDVLHLSRNHYDRIGHLAQGFIPAIVIREVLLRKSPLKRGKWLFFLVTCCCLAISAVYELIEWLVAIISGEGATAFLGTQGDVWDTQWDMFLALIGAMSSLLLLSKAHDRQLTELLRDNVACKSLVAS